VAPSPPPVHAGQGAPGRTRTTDPPHRLDKAPMIARAAHSAGVAGERIVDPLPLILSQIGRVGHEDLPLGEILAQCSLPVDSP
ncbi:MAG: hypothetical protein ABI988_16715, partial [Nitrospirota bacterium]